MPIPDDKPTDRARETSLAETEVKKGRAVALPEAPLDAELFRQVEQATGASLSDRTKREYQSDWRVFQGWCESKKRNALPANEDTIAAFLVDCAAGGHKYATLTRRATAIHYFHTLSGIDTHDSPCRTPRVRKTLAGLRRQIGVEQVRKSPLTAEHLVQIVPLVGIRERAVLLVGFATGMRRSELAALELRDVKIESRGAIFHVRRSKTDQEGRGVYIGVHRGTRICPVAALEAWVGVRGERGTTLFRIDGADVALIVKASVDLIGLDAKLFSGHSLRAGMVTEARRRGHTDVSIQRQGRWSSAKMLGVYDRPDDVFEHNVTADLGL